MERASSVALAAASRRAAAPSASAASAAIDTRKRKRGALQDISNRSKKPEVPAARGVVKKEPLRASGARATAGGRNKRAGAAPVADALPKKRRGEGEPAHQKVQSLLSFQPTASRGSRSRANVTTRSSIKEEAGAVKREVVGAKQERKRYAPSKSQSDDKENVVMEDEPMPESSDVEEQFAWAPRPYKFKFDHTGSGFSEQRYAASVRDIDAPNARKAGQCPKIVREIDAYHRQHETKYFPTPDYIGTLQTDINEKMRTILIDWLVEVGEEYELDSQTFHKAVNLVDRCLRKFKINRKQFQLLGCACMMVAAKFEEVYGPNVEEFVYISDQTYTAEEMLQMEGKVLQALEYRIASTTCYGFVHRYAQAGCASEKQKSLVMYLCDYAQLYYRMLKFRPSMVVAAAVYLARVMTGEREAWTPTLHHVTKYNAWDLRPCVLELLRLHRVEADVVASQREKAKAVSEKYFSDKFHAASAIPAVDEEVVEQSFLAFERPGSSSNFNSSSSSRDH